MRIISLFKYQIKEVLVITLFFNPPSRHPASRPEDDSSKNKGQHRCPLQFLNKEGGGERERRVHVSAEEGSLHLLQLQPFPHRETYGLIPSFRGNGLFFFSPQSLCVVFLKNFCIIISLFYCLQLVDFLEANEIQRPVTIRTNTLKTRRRDLAQVTTR